MTTKSQEKAVKQPKTKKTKLYLSDKPPLSFVDGVLLVVSYAIMILWALIIIVPIFFMFKSAFNGNQADRIDFYSAFEFSFDNFKYLFTETDFVNWVGNTLFVSISTVILTLIIVSLTAYAYSRFKFKGRRASLMTIMLIQTIPSFAGIVAYYAMYRIVSDIAPFFSSHMMLIIVYAAGGIATNTFILKGYIDSISPELDEAAKIDGCSNFKIFRLVIMPIAKPMLAIIALWSFIGPFLDYMMPSILLGNSKDYTLAAGLFTLIADEKNLNEPAFAAGGLLIAIPIVIMFVLMQRNLISGLAKGSVKG